MFNISNIDGRTRFGNNKRLNYTLPPHFAAVGISILIRKSSRATCKNKEVYMKQHYTQPILLIELMEQDVVRMSTTFDVYDELYPGNGEEVGR